MEKVQIFHNGEQVWSAGPIDGNTFFGPFRGDAKKMVARILYSQELSQQSQTSNNTIHISLETDEQIWLPIVPGAICKWDPTMEMIRGPDDEIYLRTTRDILPREELRAWFSPSLERELGISKHDMDAKGKGNGHHCTTCEMISRKNNAHALYKQDFKPKSDSHQTRFQNASSHSSQGLPSIDKSHRSPSQVKFLGIDSCINHRELQSAFRRFTHKKFPPFENPRLASLISSFSHPRHLKDASSESLADYHKKEFRKKFQGNEHYLRKHLYREGLDKCSLVRFSEEEQHYITTVSIQRPAVKFEKFETSCFENGVLDKGHLFYRSDHPQCDENPSVNRSDKCKIWNPFSSFSEAKKPKPDSEHKLDETLPEIENFDLITEDDGFEQGRIQIHDDFHDKQENTTCISKDEAANHSSSRLSDNSEEINEEECVNEALMKNVPIEQKSDKEISNNDLASHCKQEHEGKDNSDQSSNASQSLLSRYYYTRPWMFPSTMLSSLSMNEMTNRAATFASISRYQNLQPLALPYGMPPSGPQARSRVSQGFTCDFCGKVYCRKYVLKIHMRTHTGFKPLKCKFCDKSFSDPSNMKKHVKLHETENTVHKCKHCGRNFVRYRGLLNHIKSKHTEPLNMGILI